MYQLLHELVRRAAFASGAALGLASISPAQAATLLEGQFGASEAVDRTGEIGLGPGTYRFTLRSSVMLGDLSGEVEKLTTYVDYCDREGDGQLMYCGSDSVPTIPLLEATSPLAYSAVIRVLAPYTVRYGDGSYSRYQDYCCTYRFSFTAGPAGTYSWSVLAVPEPGSWLLMLLGIAAVGAALRRARRVSEGEMRSTWPSGERRSYLGGAGASAGAVWPGAAAAAVAAGTEAAAGSATGGGMPTAVPT